MKLNIKQSDCLFYTNKEQRKVVCVIPKTKNLVIEFINSMKEPGEIWWGLPSKEYHKLEMPASFSGVATCHENDTFNEETGRLIAFHKAKNKLNTSFFKRAQTYMNYLDHIMTHTMDTFNDLGERLGDNMERREQIIQERLDK